jgi:hypothetical protein
VDAPEVATICEAEDAAIEFKGDVDVHVVRRAVGLCLKVARGGEPEELAVETEVKGDEAVIEFEEKVFAVASNRVDGLVCSRSGELCRILRFGGDWMENMNSENLFAEN